MPELPEAESMRAQLEKEVQGEVIKGVKTSTKALRKPLGVSEAKLRGKKIKSLTRWGKKIFLNLESGEALEVSLGMTGKFRTHHKRHVFSEPHDHLALIFQSGKKLVYNDARRFGWIKFFENLPQTKGWDPILSSTQSFSEVMFKAQNSKLHLYSFLMSQDKVVGLGNIYVQEILFASHLSPFKKANELSQENWRQIRSQSRRILKKALDFGGSTIINYQSLNGKSGGFQKHLKVYGRGASSADCKKCKQALSFTRLGGRAVSYCSHCQKS